ncbi:anthranilate synthase component I family protein [Actinocorallia sp. B10E7]|uniref:anthranilate synthase component I family protein n=1 Tax=Actinocorallia sp. B10E7 TaxID=3153558 RepID=UPI00325D085E
MRLEVRTVRRTIPAPEPLSAFQTLAARYGADQVCLLESAAGPADDCSQHLVAFGEVLAVSVTRGLVEITGGEPLRDLVLGRTAGLVDGLSRLRDGVSPWDLARSVQELFDAETGPHGFDFGFVGYFGYDTARYLENLPYLIEQEPDLPEVHLVLYRGLLRCPLGSGRAELLLHESEAWPARDDPGLAEALAAVPSGHAASAGRVREAVGDTTRDTYVANVEKCLGHIAVGDIYQVVVGHELAFRSEADPVDVYRRLRERNPSPYMYLAPLPGGRTLVGASPELFVRVEDGTAVMRPLAGTLQAGPDDETAAARLSSDEKEIAEHVMLVDLCRNDISRICATDTLNVPELLAVERYGRVLHLVSTVAGEVLPGRDGYDVIAALFPAGTMTGAPKIRAMEIIEQLETSRRGMYAGALGLVGFGGYLNLALCIRTLVHDGVLYRTRASAGIVADSDPGREWAETLAKASAAHWAVTGRELA